MRRRRGRRGVGWEGGGEWRERGGGAVGGGVHNEEDGAGAEPGVAPKESTLRGDARARVADGAAHGTRGTSVPHDIVIAVVLAREVGSVLESTGEMDDPTRPTSWQKNKMFTWRLMPWQTPAALLGAPSPNVKRKSPSAITKTWRQCTIEAGQLRSRHTPKQRAVGPRRRECSVHKRHLL